MLLHTPHTHTHTQTHAQTGHEQAEQKGKKTEKTNLENTQTLYSHADLSALPVPVPAMNECLLCSCSGACWWKNLKLLVNSFRMLISYRNG
jgi:hypothetical protein